MASNLLSVGKSGLLAAQVGLSTTGHNIANANVPGYSRQVVVQQAGLAQNFGYGYVGSGTEVAQVKRYYDDFLSGQVRNAQSSKSSLDSFESQISQVDNLLADTTSGLSPALQDFFKGVQDVSSNPASSASRQALLSSADSLAARFQGLNGRLDEIREGVNSQVTSNVTLVNSYAKQIASLNDEISKIVSGSDSSPNDLLDKRDQLVADLNKQVKVNVTQGTNNTLTVSIGTGQPLVVGNKSFELVATASPTDPSRVQVGYVSGTKFTALSDSALSGGELGGLLDFRSTSLDRIQNSLGRVAAGIALTFNAQHKLGQDENGALGGDFFRPPTASVTSNINNIGNTTVSAQIIDASKLTTSDYRISFDGNNYSLLRASDNTTLVTGSPAALNTALAGEGLSVTFTAGTLGTAAGDNFVVRPTINGAANFSVLVTDRSKIAAAAPITTSSPTTNSGSAHISEGVVDASYLPVNGGTPLVAPANITLTYDSASGSLSGFPPAQNVNVTVNGVTTVNAAPVGSLAYDPNATYSFGGISVGFSGAPANNDTFVISANTSGVGDNRNARLLGALQTSNVLDNGSTTFQGAYAEVVSYVGNKTREVQVNGSASDALLAQATKAQQDVSGVNLDEEATNLLRYQQAYQAAGKVMQIASQLFDTLLSLGR